MVRDSKHWRDNVNIMGSRLNYAQDVKILDAIILFPFLCHL